MTPASPTGSAGSSQRPYLIRALHDWCTDNGFTPYLAVHVDHTVQVPLEYVKNSEIVLNIGFEVTSGLKMGNEFIEFKARFGGVPRDLMIPVDHVVAIYARENGSGMAFPMPVSGDEDLPALSQPAPEAPVRGLRLASIPVEGADATQPEEAASADPSTTDSPDPTRPPSGPVRPALKRIK